MEYGGIFDVDRFASIDPYFYSKRPSQPANKVFFFTSAYFAL